MSKDCDHIECLPSDLIPVSKPSKIIEKFLVKRQQQYEDYLKSMKDEMRKTDLQLEGEIHLETEILKDSLEKLKLETCELLQQTLNLSPNFSQDTNFQIFDNSSEKITTSNSASIELIDQFYVFLTGIERKRKETYKLVLNECFQNVRKMHFKIPNDLISYFQQETIKLNEITLSNHRCYAELVESLLLQVEEDLRVFSNSLMENREKYKVELKKIKARELFESKRSQTTEPQPPMRPKSSTLRSTFCFDQDIDFNGQDVEQWSKQVNDTLAYLDNGAKRLVSLYKMAMIKVFNRFFGELQNVTRFLTEGDPNEITEDITDIDIEVYQPILDDITQQYTCQVADLQKLWNTITQYMQSNLKNTYIFLQRSAHLWDDHFERLKEIQTLIIQDLKVLIEKNDRDSKKYDGKINTALDQLREASTAKELDKIFHSITKLLDSMADKNRKHCDAEIRVIEKYNVFAQKEIDVLLSELERFLRHHEQDQMISEQKQQKYSQESLRDEDNLIPIHMKACKYQVEAVNNWMFGLWETIKMYMTTCKNELSSQASKWIGEHTDKLKNRLDCKIAIHKPRYMRIRKGLYEVRLKELQEHIKMMKDLEEYATKSVIEEKDCKTVNGNDQETILEEYKTKLEEIEDKMVASKKSLQIQAYIANLEDTYNIYSQKLDQLGENYTSHNTDFLNQICTTIRDVGKKIVLFCDGGNFSNEEVKIFKKQLTKLNKSVPKKYAPILRENQTTVSKNQQKLTALKIELDAKLVKSLKEFQFKERACGEIESLKNWIRNEVYGVRFKLRRTEGYAEYFVELVEKNKENPSILNSLNETVEQIYFLLKYLMNGDSLTYVNASDDFLHESEICGRYLTRINSQINKSFKTLEKTGEEFYKSNGQVINVGKMQPNFELYMTEVIEFYNDLRQQIHVSWMVCIQDVMELILDLVTFIDYFQKRYPDRRLQLGENIDILEHLMR